MDSLCIGNTYSSHVVAIPFQARGFINAMLNTCRLLSSKPIIISFVVTQEWLSFISSEPRPPNIQLLSIPNVLPSLDSNDYFEAVVTKMKDPVEQLLDRLELPLSYIIADTYLSWAVHLGERRNIPVGLFWTMSPSVFTVFHHFHLLVSNGHFPVHDLSERGDELVDYIPGLASARLADLHTDIQYSSYGKDDNDLRRKLEAFSCVAKAQCILFTSFYELEANAIDTLRENLSPPIYSIGPSIPYMTLHENSADANSMDYYNWLDSQPANSVLYISFGSFLKVLISQMEEFAKGLCSSRTRFLWVMREEADALRLRDLCGEMGMVVPWCEQLKVLCHASVGGFLTHCGWNSTLEAVFAGVPMLTFPLYYDQFTDSKLIVEDWKVGIGLKREVSGENVINGGEIAQFVERLMDLDGDESKELRKRAKELQEVCKRAIGKGGSSYTDLHAFFRDIEQSHSYKDKDH